MPLHVLTEHMFSYRRLFYRLQDCERTDNGHSQESHFSDMLSVRCDVIGWKIEVILFFLGYCQSEIVDLFLTCCDPFTTSHT